MSHTPCTTGTVAVFNQHGKLNCIPVEAWTAGGDPLIVTSKTRGYIGPLSEALRQTYGEFLGLIPGGIRSIHGGGCMVVFYVQPGREGDAKFREYIVLEFRVSDRPDLYPPTVVYVDEYGEMQEVPIKSLRGRGHIARPDDRANGMRL